MVTRKYMRQLQAARLGSTVLDTKQRTYLAPARAGNLEGLAPAFIAVGSLDLFLDEDCEYALRLTRAGVAVELHVYRGVFHGFDLIPGKATDRFSSDLNAAIGEFLEQQ